MVRKCQVCGKLQSYNPNLSFHRFPSDIERKNIWLSILDLADAKNLPQNMFLCSEHFDPKDFGFRVNGTKYLKSDANPIPVKQFFGLTSSSSSSTVNETSPSAKRDEVPPIDTEIFQNIDAIGSPKRSVENVESPAVKLEQPVQNLNLMPTSFTEKPSSSQIRRGRKGAYVGEIHTSDFSTPEKRKRSMNIIRKKVHSQNRKIRTLQQSVRRMKHKITSMKTLLDYLREQSLVSESAEATISASVNPGAASDIFQRMLEGRTKQKYNPTLRAFALTLAFYSPKGYNFVRKTFNNSLPHLDTISKWYRSVDGSPGFTNEAFTALSLRQKEVSHPLLCNLVMDEMSITRQVEWTGSKFTGYVDVGTNLDSDILPEAREALVFMLVCLNGSWKIPVGYFLVNGLVATEKAELVKKCLGFLHESGIKVISLTFDGAPSNFSMAEKLGADFSDPSNLKTKCECPFSQHEIFVNPDACHMIKLVRNCFASQSGLRNIENMEVKWSYVTNLVDKQDIEGLHAATKLRNRHLQWMREKMKVRLATQTLSKSVSDAIDFLRDDLKCPDFQGSEATSDFILKFNNLFDIFNSRNHCAKYFFKKPFMSSTFEAFTDFLSTMKRYIHGLTLNGVPITRSGRKTGFLGFLICIESLEQMYKKYIIEEKMLKYLLTYKLSQDHLELFFGCIRSKGGYNNNPTARQFEAAYKRLIVHSQISATDTGNAINLESISILTCGSADSILKSEYANNIRNVDQDDAAMKSVFVDMEKFEFATSTAWNLTPYAEDIVGYISGYVVRIIEKSISCRKCLDILRCEVDISFLQKRKTYGKLIRASQLVINVCKEGEKFFKFFHKTTSILNRKVEHLLPVLINQTMHNIGSSILDHFENHLYDGNFIDGHADQLIKIILKKYFIIRSHHETTKLLDVSRKNRSRSLNTKVILFRNE